MVAKARGKHLQETYDLAVCAVELLPVLSVRDLFGPDAQDRTRTVLGRLWEDAWAVLAPIAQSADMRCGMCPMCTDPRPEAAAHACPLALTDLVEAFKTGARDAAFRRELTPLATP